MRKINIYFYIAAASFWMLIFWLLYSCEKKTIEPTTTNQSSTCNCYEYHEIRDVVNNVWVFDYETLPQPDLCEKQTGEWIYVDSKTTLRYKVNCN